MSVQLLPLQCPWKMYTFWYLKHPLIMEVKRNTNLKIQT